MPKITVRKCPITKKVFFGDDEYAEHIVALRARKTLERINRRNRVASTDRVWDIIENDVCTIPQLEQFIKDFLHDIYIAYNGGRPEVNDAVRESALKSFTLIVGYDECVSNTHDSPRNGVNNFSCDPDLPRHYPGFVGRLTFDLTNDPENHPSMTNGKIRTCMRFTDALGYIGIHTGSGGGGATISYEVRLFQDDFPGIRRSVFKAKLEDSEVDLATLR